MKRGQRDERGSTIEVVILFPIMFVLVLLIIDFSLFYLSAIAARSAAQEGVSAARSMPLTDCSEAARISEAQTVAVNFSQSSNSPLTPAQVTTSIDADCNEITVAVDTRAKSILGLSIPIRVQSTGTIEIFRPDTP